MNNHKLLSFDELLKKTDELNRKYDALIRKTNQDMQNLQKKLGDATSKDVPSLIKNYLINIDEIASELIKNIEDANREYSDTTFTVPQVEETVGEVPNISTIIKTATKLFEVDIPAINDYSIHQIGDLVHRLVFLRYCIKETISDFGNAFNRSYDYNDFLAKSPLYFSVKEEALLNTLKTLQDDFYKDKQVLTAELKAYENMVLERNEKDSLDYYLKHHDYNDILEHNHRIRVGNLKPKIDPVLYLGEFQSQFEALNETPVYIDLNMKHSHIYLKGAEDTESVRKFVENYLYGLVQTHNPKELQFYIVSPFLDNDFNLYFLTPPFKGIHAKVFPTFPEVDTMLNELEAENTSRIGLLGRDQSLFEYNKGHTFDTRPSKCIFINGFPNAYSNEQISRMKALAKEGARLGFFMVFLEKEVEITTRHSLTIEKIYSNILNEVTTVYQIKDKELFLVNEETLQGPITVWTRDVPSTTVTLVNDIVSQGANKEVDAVKLKTIVGGQNRNIIETSKLMDIPIGIIGNQVVSYKPSITAPHLMIAAVIGAGKSVLLHDIIGSIAYKYSPDQAELYLLDLKGSEFTTTYLPPEGQPAIPHIKMLGSSDIDEYDVYSFLKRIKEIFDQRNELMNIEEIKARDIEAYNTTVLSKPEFAHKYPTMARVFVIIDEFASIFNFTTMTEPCLEILTLLVNKGRSYGISLVLCSQNLPTTHGFPTLLSNFHHRIALKSAESDFNTLTGLKTTSAEFAYTSHGKGAAVYYNSGESNAKPIAFKAAYTPQLKEFIDDIIDKEPTKVTHVVVSGRYADVNLKTSNFTFIKQNQLEQFEAKVLAIEVGQSPISGASIKNEFSSSVGTLYLVGDNEFALNSQSIMLLSAHNHNKKHLDAGYKILYLDVNGKRENNATIKTFENSHVIHEYISGYQDVTNKLQELYASVDQSVDGARLNTLVFVNEIQALIEGKQNTNSAASLDPLEQLLATSNASKNQGSDALSKLIEEGASKGVYLVLHNSHVIRPNILHMAKKASHFFINKALLNDFMETYEATNQILNRFIKSEYIKYDPPIYYPNSGVPQKILRNDLGSVPLDQLINNIKE